ncbi:unnamed protein product, partial [marine sediment metagenome]
MAPPHGGAIQNEFLFFAVGNMGLKIWDVSDPLNPVERGKFVDLSVFETFVDIDVTGNNVYVACQDRLRVIDISDPDLPKAPAGGTQGICLENSDKIVVYENTAYVLGSGSLKVIDISNSETPVLSNSIPMTEVPEDLLISSGMICAWNAKTVTFFDIT